MGLVARAWLGPERSLREGRRLLPFELNGIVVADPARALLAPKIAAETVLCSGDAAVSRWRR